MVVGDLHRYTGENKTPRVAEFVREKLPFWVAKQKLYNAQSKIWNIKK